MKDKRVATEAEVKVMSWLDRRNISYLFQSSLSGGYFKLGETIVDFLFPFRRIAFRTMGENWQSQASQSGEDILQKEVLKGLGYTVVDLWGEDLDTRLDETLSRALLGQEMVRGE